MRLGLRAGCKGNLYLASTGVRENGYHELETLFYPVSHPHDEMEFAWGEDEGAPGPDGRPGVQAADGLRLWCSLPGLESASNIVVKAYEAFAARTGFRPGLAVFLNKGIPHGAGLGGGSADAAAMLGFLNGQAGDKALDAPGLNALAARLGADVPFFLMNRPAWATGIGEELMATDAGLSGMTLLVAMPEERVNTAWAYKAWDVANLPSPGIGETKTRSPAFSRDTATFLQPPCPLTIRALLHQGRILANSFEPVVFTEHPAVRRLKERLYALGASAAGMSGSGSAVYGLFKTSGQASGAASSLEQAGIAHFTSLL